jgi:hypothetical protein
LSQGKTKSLPFNWEKFFVPSKTECFLACFAMSARYWASYFPELNLPTDLETWKEFAATSFVEYRGTSISARAIKRAWSECRNLQIITYPKGMITLVSGPVVGIVKQQEISSYFEGEE